MKELVEYVARFLVRNPDAVAVVETVREGTPVVEKKRVRLGIGDGARAASGTSAG